jgi:hypothetical protein
MSQSSKYEEKNDGSEKRLRIDEQTGFAFNNRGNYELYHKGRKYALKTNPVKAGKQSLQYVCKTKINGKRCPASVSLKSSATQEFSQGRLQRVPQIPFEIKAFNYEHFPGCIAPTLAQMRDRILINEMVQENIVNKTHTQNDHRYEIAMAGHVESKTLENRL